MDRPLQWRYQIVGNAEENVCTHPPSVVATIPVGAQPSGVAVTPDGKYAFVANFFSHTVSVIATATNTVVKTVPVGA
jgi:YVTN family beta-propeller protein